MLEMEYPTENKAQKIWSNIINKPYCLLCGQPLNESKFVIPFQDRFLHVVCEQEILNEPYLSNGIIFEYGIHEARGT